MRSKSEVQQRVRALLVQELDRRAELASKRLPRLCVHNHKHSLDDRKKVDGEPNEMFNRIGYDNGDPVERKLGLCMLGAENPEEWGGTICEDAIDAQRCPHFQPTVTKESLLVEFQEQLSAPGGLEKHLPAAAELLWVLEGTMTPKLPWWKLLWYRFLRIRVEPPLTATAQWSDVLGLLGPGADDESLGS